MGFRRFLFLIIVYSVLITAFVTFYYAYFLPNFPPNLVTRFHFIENEWFNAENVRILDNFRLGGVATPNDELIYEITYQNKKNETLAISSQLTVIFGGKEVKKINGSNGLVVPPLSSNTEKVFFQAEHQGENQIRLTVNIMNATDSTVIQSVPTVINIEVVII